MSRRDLWPASLCHSCFPKSIHEAKPKRRPVDSLCRTCNFPCYFGILHYWNSAKYQNDIGNDRLWCLYSTMAPGTNDGFVQRHSLYNAWWTKVQRMMLCFIGNWGQHTDTLHQSSKIIHTNNSEMMRFLEPWSVHSPGSICDWIQLNLFTETTQIKETWVKKQSNLC